MLQWLADHEAAALAEAVAPFYPDVRTDLLTRALARYRAAGVWATTPEVSRAGFARLADSLVSGGFITREPRYEHCVDTSM
jgi:NitT/TauT family transport system substrate-binding protein